MRVLLREVTASGGAAPADRALGGLQLLLQQAHHGRLTDAVAPDDGDLVTPIDARLQPVDDGLALRIGEADLVETDDVLPAGAFEAETDARSNAARGHHALGRELIDLLLATGRLA